MDIDNLYASDETGEAVIANIETDRTVSATTLDVDSVDNWPQEFIFVTGTQLPSGYIDASDACIMTGHLSGADIIIDGYEPGYSDVGHTAGQVAIVKMTTGWADRVAEALAYVKDYIDNFAYVQAPRETTMATGSDLDVNVDDYDLATVTALATTLTVNAPTGTPVDGQKLLIRIKTSGTQTVSWNAIFRTIGVDLPTSIPSGKTFYIGCLYNDTDTKWDVLAVGEEE